MLMGKRDLARSEFKVHVSDVYNILHSPLNTKINKRTNLTHWGWDKMVDILEITFWNIYLMNKNNYISTKI